MKKAKQISLFMAICVLALSSCIKPITDDGPVPTPNITCLVDGKEWKGLASATIDPVYGNFKLISTSTSNAINILNLQLVAAKPFVYALGTNSRNIVEYSQDKTVSGGGYATGNAPDASGTVIITSINKQAKTISGIFSFVAARTNDGAEKTVTNGVFTDVLYKGDPPLKSSILYAKLNGVDWNAENTSFFSNQDGFRMNFSDNTGKNMSFILLGSAGPGTYPLSSNGTAKAVFTDASFSFQCISGTLNIASRTATGITGSFSYNGFSPNIGTIDITSGVFDADF